MNKALLLLSLYLFFFSFAQAQQGDRMVTTIALAPAIDKQVFEESLPFTNTPPFFSYFVEWPEGDLEINIRFLDANHSWTPWLVFERDEHNVQKQITQLHFGEVGYRRYQLKFTSNKFNVPSVNFHVFTPGESRIFTPIESSTVGRNLLACPCPMPAFQNRNDWCSTATCPEHPSPSITQVTHLIIHHSAGSNSSNDWAATVRAIWDYHVNGNGWSDVGYNWLIEPNGIIYQGREDNVLGAHFCGQNSKTMGVCMLGTFTSQTPSSEATNSLESLLAWKSCDRDFDPLGASLHPSSGLTLNHISGHRDGCNTECPGDSFYPMLPSIRQEVADMIENNCATVATNDPWLASESLILSPNPVRDQFSFQFKSILEGELHWQIKNLQQQLIMEGISMKQHSSFSDNIIVNHLSAGIYFFEININGQKGIWKIIHL